MDSPAAGAAAQSSGWLADPTKGQKKKNKQKRFKKQREQEPQKGQQEEWPVSAPLRGNASEWLAGIRQQPYQVRLDLAQWTRRAEILHSWRDLAAWGGPHEGVPF